MTHEAVESGSNRMQARGGSRVGDRTGGRSFGTQYRPRWFATTTDSCRSTRAERRGGGGAIELSLGDDSADLTTALRERF